MQVENKQKQGLLDCLQEYGVRDMSAKRLIVTETTGTEKDSITVTETEYVEKCNTEYEEECTTEQQQVWL